MQDKGQTMSIRRELVDWVLGDPPELKEKNNLLKTMDYHLYDTKDTIANYADECSMIKGKLIVPEETIEALAIELDIFAASLIGWLKDIDNGDYTQLVREYLNGRS